MDIIESNEFIKIIYENIDLHHTFGLYIPLSRSMTNYMMIFVRT